MRLATEILAAQTGAGNSRPFTVEKDTSVTVMTDIDLAGAETADIQITHDGGTTWKDYLDGAAVELTATLNALRLYGPATYRVAKDATASATAVLFQD